MTDRSFELTRRKALAGLATVGAAGAGAGLGTSALFNDTESFENNILEAGKLDLVVDYYTSTDQGSFGSSSDSGTFNGNQEDEYSYTVSDVKPGDTGVSDFCFEIDDNPAYLWMCGGLRANLENGQNEAEQDDGDGESTDSTGGDPGPGQGELADAIEATVRYCQITMGSGGSGTRTRDKGEIITSGTLREVMNELSSGIPLDGTGDSSATAGGQTCYAGIGGGPESATNPCICIDWEIPKDVGNEIQSDSVKYDVEFHAVQCRNSDGTMNPCTVDQTVTRQNAAEYGFQSTSDESQLGSGAWCSTPDNGSKELFYLPLDSLPSFTVGDIEEISYHTKKPTDEDSVDFYLLIYTEPQTSDGTDQTCDPGTDDESWYNKRLNAEPLYSNSLNAPSNQWNEWSTTSGDNQLTFFDAGNPTEGCRTNIGFYGGPTLADLQSGSTDWGTYTNSGSSQTVDYSDQEIKYIAISSGSGWQDGFESCLDNIQVALKTGDTLTIDLEN